MRPKPLVRTVDPNRTYTPEAWSLDIPPHIQEAFDAGKPLDGGWIIWAPDDDIYYFDELRRRLFRKPL